MFEEKTIDTETQCYHCGDPLPTLPYLLNDKAFCCIGCQGVYRILSENNLCNYYVYNDIPGQTQLRPAGHFEYLEEPAIVNNLVDYIDDKYTVITFYVPAIHCSSCIWLMENLHRLNPAIQHSRIDFLKKTVNISFKNCEISLRKVVETMTSVGYEPLISLQDVVKKQQSDRSERNLVAKIAVAGFCFGNVMLLSFPDYFGLSRLESEFRAFFGWLNIAFSLPVVFYSGKDYFISAYANLKNKVLSLDFPLALGIAVMFIRTIAEICTYTGAGFADTLCGLVFFLLVGKWMQQRTYHHLSFERDYRSYFPVAVTIINGNNTKPIPLCELQQGQRMLIRSNEIIPADAILLKGEAEIDFSFVTGESIPVKKILGEIVYAGGRQLKGAIELEVVKPVSQSYLTSLWNNEAFFAEKDRIKTFSDTASKYFSILLLMIALGSGSFWMLMEGDGERAVAAFTAVLIIACPCALALSSPFTLAAVLSIFDKNKFYLKSTAVVEELARINTFVFDKTGTITNPEAECINFNGKITNLQMQLVADLAVNSGHPLSRELVKLLKRAKQYSTDDYEEKIGRGISGRINGYEVKLGSSAFIGLPLINSPTSSTIHVMIDQEYLGHFQFNQQWRNGFKELIQKLGKSGNLHLVSGDQSHHKNALVPFFPRTQQMQFEQSPHDKLRYIENLQKSGNKVMMLGDGLNDAGALRQSNVGVAVTDNINNFSPDCDVILDGTAFSRLPMFLQQAKDAVKVIHMSFGISLGYNAVGLYFAVQGLLSPLIAAILMPVSTVTIILFTSIATRLYAHKNKLL